MTEYPDPDPRQAIVDHREAIQAEPRPAPLTPMDLAAEVASEREVEDVYRVYITEWVTRYVSQHSGEQGYQEAKAHFDAVYAGRVRDADMRIEDTIGGLSALQLRVPNLRGDFKIYTDAQLYADTTLRDVYPDETPQIVVRSSRADLDLQSYGVKKLPGK